MYIEYYIAYWKLGLFFTRNHFSFNTLIETYLENEIILCIGVGLRLSKYERYVACDAMEKCKMLRSTSKAHYVENG